MVSRSPALSGAIWYEVLHLAVLYETETMDRRGVQENLLTYNTEFGRKNTNSGPDKAL